MTPNRRTFLKAGFLAAGGVLGNSAYRQYSPAAASASQVPKGKIPTVLHQSDLFHPASDPDDHFDLAVLYALMFAGYFNLEGVILDYDLRDRDPGIFPIMQLNRLTGHAVPGVPGSTQNLRSRNDQLPDLSIRDLAAANHILATLENSSAPVMISSVGSARDIAIAANRRPDLFEKNCAGVFISAGAAFPNPNPHSAEECNASMDPNAFAAMFDIPAPLYWIPAIHSSTGDRYGEYASRFTVPQKAMLEGVSDSLIAFFYFTFACYEGRTDVNERCWLQAIDRPVTDEMREYVYKRDRNMWSVPAFYEMAGLTVTRDGDLVPLDEIAQKDRLYQMEDIEVTCSDEIVTEWKPTDKPQNRKIFHILAPERYPEAMAKSINQILKRIV